jgi:hypothetical protein
VIVASTRCFSNLNSESPDVDGMISRCLIGS